MTTSVSGFDELCPYWELFERSGLTENIAVSIEYLASPVLLLGSGQGLVSQALQDLGLDVISVDASLSMIEHGRRRRGIDATQGDAASVVLGRQFSTVIVNSGVVTNLNAATAFIAPLITNVDRHLDGDGHALLAYLKRSPSTDCLAHLGLFERPSTNAIFWERRASIDDIKRSFVERGYDANAIELAFAVFADNLDRHRALIENLGEAYRKTHAALPPAEFFDNCADLGCCHLTKPSEQSLLNAIEERHVIIDRFEPEPTTTLLAWRRR